MGRTSLLVCSLLLLLLPARGTAATRLGFEPAPDVLLAAETSEAVCAWFRAGLRGRPLVLISARLPIASQALAGAPERERLAAALTGSGCPELRGRTGSQPRKDALYDPDNFLLAAHALGLVREVWWVVPSRRLPEGDLAPFRDWLRATLGLPEEFVESLRQEGATMSGSYRGLPVRLATLADLRPPAEPVLVAIDAEYLMKLFANPVSRGMLDLVGDLFAALRAVELRANLPVVASSHEGGKVPMGYAHLAGWLRDLLANPGAFAEGAPETWRLQGQIEYLDYLLARDDALAQARRLSELEPKSPVPLFDQAQIVASRGQATEARRLLEEAVGRDPRYRFGYLTLAGALLDRQLQAEAESLLEAGHARFPGDAALALPLANLYAERGDFARAAALLAAVATANPDHPGVHAANAFALRGAGREAEAAEAMERFRRSAPPGGQRDRALEAWAAGGPATEKP
jgi:tetratricopeptide (TPR) repeat protein